MSGLRNTLQSKFQEANRYSNFGEILNSIHIKGFRCHSNTLIEFKSPISAFCGLNGTGKSTILQLAAAGYRAPSNDSRNFYIKDFIITGVLDPAPFRDDASTVYKFWQLDRSTKQVTLSRNSPTKRWSGYPRRPKKNVYFAGVGIYLPRVEQRDFIVRNSKNITVTDTRRFDDRVKDWTCRILNHAYDEIDSNEVKYQKRSGIICSVNRSGVSYSEAHMGYGEGRTQHIITSLESIPDKSLVLLEEPETSLHPSAQYKLGQYLVDVSVNKGHQILISTHSEFLLEALPSLSRIYLHKDQSDICAIFGLTAAHARSLMSEGHSKSLCIIVEDNFAKTVLIEIIRRIDAGFLSVIGVYAAGSSQTIATVVNALDSTEISIAGVRDGDQGENASNNLFKLPGSNAPEIEIFNAMAVSRHLQEQYGYSLADFLAANRGSNHHEWSQKIANDLSLTEDSLISELSKIYANSLPENEAGTLVNQLKEVSRT